MKTNATERKGGTATWITPMNDFLGRPEAILEVTYKTVGAASARVSPPPAPPAAK